MMLQAILVVNIGSSTIKFAVYPIDWGQIKHPLLKGQISGLESIGQTATISWLITETNASSEKTFLSSATPFVDALHLLQDLIAVKLNGVQIVSVGHRVVHGGDLYQSAVLVTEEVLANLKKFESLAPLHQPHNLAGIRLFDQVFPNLPQVACFDTAFHAPMPLLEKTYAVGDELKALGMHKYGFHGLSYQYVLKRLEMVSGRAQDRVLMAHLGNGASLCATQGGRSCATTMGYSAIEGLMMGTRSGSIDPGILIHLMDAGWTSKEIANYLYQKSGLKGVSGISADMQTLRQSSDPRAQFAIDLFTYRVIRECGALSAILGGLDLIAFTGGIGEHDTQLRHAVCQQLQYLGVSVDPNLNLKASSLEMSSIHAASSSIEVWVVQTDEGSVVAEQTLALTAHIHKVS